MNILVSPQLQALIWDSVSPSAVTAAGRESYGRTESLKGRRGSKGKRQNTRQKINVAEINGGKTNYAKLNGAKKNGARINYGKINGVKIHGAKVNYGKINGLKINGAT